MENLITINLSDNIIETIEGFGKALLHPFDFLGFGKADQNPKIHTLLLKRNRIGINGLSDLVYLTKMPALGVLDLTDNKIEDPEILPQVLEKMPKIAVLYLCNNPVIRKIKDYRKTLISRIPTLKYLDDRPVFPEERRFAEAWARGGYEEERLERKKHKEEQEKEREDNRRAFNEMIEKGKRERREREEAERERNAQNRLEEESKNSSHSHSRNETTLETYYSTESEKSRETPSNSEESSIQNEESHENSRHEVESQENSRREVESNASKTSAVDADDIQLEIGSEPERTEEETNNGEREIREDPIESEHDLQGADENYLNELD